MMASCESTLLCTYGGRGAARPPVSSSRQPDLLLLLLPNRGLSRQQYVLATNPRAALGSRSAAQPLSGPLRAGCLLLHQLNAAMSAATLECHTAYGVLHLIWGREACLHGPQKKQGSEI